MFLFYDFYSIYVRTLNFLLVTFAPSENGRRNYIRYQIKFSRGTMKHEGEGDQTLKDKKRIKNSIIKVAIDVRNTFFIESFRS